jgi:glycerophosphoryl diester phosphodiesterase
MEVIGHRGSGKGREENTLAGCRQAVQAGARRVEVDVQRIGGVFLLAHPPRRNGETLAALLENPPCPLVLHIKRRRFNPWHDRAVVDEIARLTESADVMIESFWPGTLAYAKRHHPQVQRAFATAWAWYDVRFSRRLGFAELVCRDWIIGPRAVAVAEKRGVNITVYTPRNTERSKARLRRAGVAAVMTDAVVYWTERSR